MADLSASRIPRKLDGGEEVVEGRFDGSSPKHAVHVDEVCEAHRRHPLAIGGTSALKFLRSTSRIDRSQRRTAIEVPQQKRLMARLLPNEPKTFTFGEYLDPSVTLWTQSELVRVEQDGSLCVGTEPPHAVAHQPACSLDYGQRVATSGLHEHDIEVGATVLCIDQPGQQSAIALLALTFAGEKDPPTLRDESAASPHPMTGTAP
nr:hypothetical protein [Methylorubrum sp. Q1]